MDLHHPEGWLPHAVFLGFWVFSCAVRSRLRLHRVERVEVVVVLLLGVGVVGVGVGALARCAPRTRRRRRPALAGGGLLALAAGREPRFEVGDVVHAELGTLVGGRCATLQSALVETPLVETVAHLLGELGLPRCLGGLRLLRFLGRLGCLRFLGLPHGLAGLASEQGAEVDDGNLATLARLATAHEPLRDRDALLHGKDLGLHACEPRYLLRGNLDTVRKKLGREQSFATEELDRLVHGLGTGVGHHFDDAHERLCGGSHDWRVTGE